MVDQHLAARGGHLCHGLGVRAGLTRGQSEAPAQHICNAMQLLLAVDACALPPAGVSGRISPSFWDELM